MSARLLVNYFRGSNQSFSSDGRIPREFGPISHLVFAKVSPVLLVATETRLRDAI